VFERWQIALLEECRAARLATVAASGRPHLVPVCYALCDGRVVIPVDEKPKRGGRLARLRNVGRDPRVALLADRYVEDWRRLAWVRVDGDALVLERGDEWPAAIERLRERYPQYEAMALEALPLIVISPRRVAGWRWSDE